MQADSVVRTAQTRGRNEVEGRMLAEQAQHIENVPLNGHRVWVAPEHFLDLANNCVLVFFLLVEVELAEGIEYVKLIGEREEVAGVSPCLDRSCGECRA